MSDNDLIRRGDAIRAIEEEGYKSQGDVLKGLTKAHVIVAGLLTPQPEIIHCKDCKYNTKNPRLYFDDDEIETYIHCQFMEPEGFCSLGKKEQECKTN